MLFSRMLFPRRRQTPFLLVGFTILILAFYHLPGLPLPEHHPAAFGVPPYRPPPGRPRVEEDGRFHWHTRKEAHPVTSFIPLPTGKPASIPRIQHVFKKETKAARELREKRLQAVKQTFLRNWNGYRAHAWLKDELTPLSAGYKDTYGGWAATLVDSLDTLWIMGLRPEFEEAVEAVGKIDFTRSRKEVVSVFETTIRYLGGLLAAHDLSGGEYPVLLEKAVELGDMLYAAFDTPNRMPIVWWKWEGAKEGVPQEAGMGDPVACIGSLSLEFTRLSQLTEDPKFFDAIQRITDLFDKSQRETHLPGMWPVMVNSNVEDFTSGSDFTFGALADSLYEYFPKEYLLLGGLSPQYRDLYETMLPVAQKHIFFRPLNPHNADILISGSASAYTPNQSTLLPEAQHLACFVGGMVALGSRIFSRPADLPIARKLTDGCLYYYEHSPSGIMPESFHLLPCTDPTGSCTWNETLWHTAILPPNDNPALANPEEEPYSTRLTRLISERRLSPGLTHLTSRKYILRPEAIESVFLLYRITGDPILLEKAWMMFQSIERATKTDVGNAAVGDVTLERPVRQESMESFWLAETLKYFFLVFSEPKVVGLDGWVFNTEAHPFLRPR